MRRRPPRPTRTYTLVPYTTLFLSVTDQEAALAEMLRVLKVGGQARVLEFSPVKADWLRPLYDFHSFQVLPRLGTLFAQDADSSQYLAESIRKHPPPDELTAMLENADFASCAYRHLSAGIVAIHTR